MITTTSATMRSFGKQIRSLAGTAAIALATLGASMPAEAQSISYPRVIESGENKDIDYGPAGNQGPIFGGGRVVTTGTGEDVQLHHLDPQYVQRAPAGLIPITVGSGENTSTAWVPAPANMRNLAMTR